MYLIRVCLLLVMPLIACGQVRAQPVVAELTQSDQHDLTKHLQILEDPAGSLSFDQIQKKPLTAFRVFDAQLSLNDQSVYWLYLRVANRTNRRQWQWRLPFLKLTHGDFYYNSSAQKAFTKYKIGIFEKRGPNDGRLSVGEKFNLVLTDLPKGDTATIYVRLQNQKKYQPPTIQLSAAPLTQRMINARENLYLALGILIGILFIIQLFCLLLFLQTHDRSYLLYFLYLLNFLMWMMFSVGPFRNFLMDALPWLSPKYIFLLRSAGVFIPTLYLLFLWHFGNLQEHLPKWRKHIVRIMWLLVGLFLLDWVSLFLTDFNFIFSNLCQLSANIIMMTVLALWWPSLYRKRKLGNLRFILAGISVYYIGMIGVVIRLVVNRFGSIYAVEAFFAQGVELLIFTVGLAYKYRDSIQLKLENDKIKELLEDRELLLKEIHHRVKNNLQVVSSLLNIQSRKTDDPQIRKALLEGKDRVRVMSLIHQHLYTKDNLRGIEVRNYLQQLCEQIMLSYQIGSRVKLQTDFDPLVIDIETAVPIGLINNELVNNALKYAFPEERTGTIFVSLKKQGPLLVFSVADDGVGMDTEPADSGTSFGFSLIRTFSSKLKAELSIEQQNGTTVTLKISAWR